jgi:hypothetical protein
LLIFSGDIVDERAVVRESLMRELDERELDERA